MKNAYKFKNVQICRFLNTCVWTLPKKAAFDLSYICNKNNLEEIHNNILSRKKVGNIKLLQALKEKLDTTSINDSTYNNLEKQFYEELLKVPNKTHPNVKLYGNEAKVINTIGEKPKFSNKPLEFDEIVKRLKLVRTDQLGNLSGSKSYYIMGELAELEQALIKYVVKQLLRRQFQMLSVPDIVHRNIIEGCGMNTKGTRTQVYFLQPKLHGPDLCLSGTSEIGIAGFLINKTFREDELPLKFVAVSRCYRAETSNITEERGIFRVHEFTKVEMFVVTSPEKSDQQLEEIRSIQETIFKHLNLHCLVLDMPPHELGAQAYRKYDLEAWMSGREVYGEISSCSNCTDYQAQRLGIKYKNENGEHFVHTLNGTACAIPRLLIALVEGGQNPKGTISVPEVLQKYMNDKKSISKQKTVPNLKLIKYKI